MDGYDHDLGRIETRVEHLIEGQTRIENRLETLSECMTGGFRLHEERLRAIEIEQARAQGMGRGLLIVWGLVVAVVSNVLAVLVRKVLG